MVCFAQFRYSVNTKDVPQFIVNANRYFPNTEWSITYQDLTIKTSDLMYGVGRLQPKTGDVVIFDTGRIWRDESFVRSIPNVDFERISVTDEQRAKWSETAAGIDVSDGTGGGDWLCRNTADFEYSDIPVILKLIHERTPLEGFYLCPSTGEAWVRRSTYGHLHIYPSETSDEKKYTYSNSCKFIFDFDDGFCANNDHRSVPIEFQEDFAAWTKNGYAGEVLKVRL